MLFNTNWRNFIELPLMLSLHRATAPVFIQTFPLHCIKHGSYFTEMQKLQVDCLFLLFSILLFSGGKGKESNHKALWKIGKGRRRKLEGYFRFGL